MMCTEKIISEMKARVYHANQLLPTSGLVKLTWGNVSEINRELGIVVIKPSGVPYQELRKEDMVVSDLEGSILEGNSLKPSSDLPTHLTLYSHFPHMSAVVHTHSLHAVSWAQAGRDLPAYGTTHADTFYGSVPCTRQLTKKEIQEEYEENTGHVIVETFKKRQIDPHEVPGVLVFGHGPFTWGDTPKQAVEHSLILDEICRMAKETESLNTQSIPIPQYLLDKHFYRKHGLHAYYGQS